jgi:TonB-linked SusC/RagA family outer membrane protein
MAELKKNHTNRKTGKYLRILKAILLLMFVGIGIIHANSGYSQNLLLSLKVHNKTLKDVFRIIEDQSEYIFFYNDEAINEHKRVDVSVEKGTIHQVLDKILDTDSKYRVEDRQIIIYKDRTADGGKAADDNPAQAKTAISGLVIDDKGEPLPGVIVSLKKTTTVVVTDEKGRFNLTGDNASEMIIHFQLLGKKPLEIRYTGQKEMKVVMENSVEEIQSVVVTGIFNKPRESYTGAVTLITAKELNHAGNQNLISRIGNIDPSFFILENNSMGSDPNTLPDIQIRGNTSLTVGIRELQDDSRSTATSNLPLFILEGFEVDLQQVMDLDPNLVESVTLLKDASATAMYGSRGANGIMVITKKQPEQGKLRFTYKGDLNISVPDLTSYHLLNAADKLEYELAAGLYTSSVLSYQIHADQLYSERRAEIERGVDTYWLKYPVRVGVGQKHSIRFDGGENNLLYAAGINYANTLGVMKESGRNTLSGNIYLQYTYKKLRFRNELGVSSNKAFNSSYGEFSLYAKLNPYWTPYENDGALKKILDNYKTPGSANVQTPGNPLYDATLPYRNDNGYDQYYNNFSIHWNILPGASIQGRYKITRSLSHSDRYISAKHSSFNQYSGSDYTRRGSYFKSNGSTNQYEGDITANYNKTFNKRHQLYAGFNFNFGQYKSENNTVKAEGYAASNLHQFGLANSYERNGTPQSSDSYSRRLGSVLNLNYTYAGRYYIDMSGKMDGSSKFGINSRIAPFWSAGIGWNMHNESFMKDLEFLNYLRWRASFGTTGSQNFNPYQARTTFQFYKSQTYQHWTGSYMVAMGNPDLRWQSTQQFNGGFEYSLFDNRWKLTADFYNKLTYGVLMDVNLPMSGGFENYKTNMGEVRNSGFELSTSVFLIKDTENAISWLIGGSVLQNRNKVLKISNALDFLNEQINSNPADYRNPSFPVKEGESLNTIFVVKSLGIDPSTGREIFEKLDGTHTFTWDSKDRIAYGVTDPDFWGNFNTMFRYKGFSLNVSFSYRTGGYRYNQTLVNKVENVDPWYNVDQRVYDDRWKNPGDLARFKSIQLIYSNTYASSRFVMKENTLECRLINLTYEVDPQWVKKKLKMDFLSLGLYSENPFYASSIKQERGTSYPFAHSYSFSLTTRF